MPQDEEQHTENKNHQPGHFYKMTRTAIVSAAVSHQQKSPNHQSQRDESLENPCSAHKEEPEYDDQNQFSLPRENGDSVSEDFRNLQQPASVEPQPLVRDLDGFRFAGPHGFSLWSPDPNVREIGHDAGVVAEILQERGGYHGSTVAILVAHSDDLGDRREVVGHSPSVPVPVVEDVFIYESFHIFENQRRRQIDGHLGPQFACERLQCRGVGLDQCIGVVPMLQVAEDQARIGETDDDVHDPEDGPLDRPSEKPPKSVEGSEEERRLKNSGQEKPLRLHKSGTLLCPIGRAIIVRLIAGGCRPMTLLIASTFAETVHELEMLAPLARNAGADAVEARIDIFRDDLAVLNRFLQQNGDRTWLITCRSHSEGGRFPGDGADAAYRALEAVEGTLAWVDVELVTWRAGSKLRSKVMSHLKAQPSAKLILSAHFLEGAPADMASVVEEALREGPQVVAKVAYTGSHIADSFLALDLMERFRSRVIAICMGEAGAWTRVLAKKLGTFATVASIGNSTSTAPGQWSVEDLGEYFGWDRIDASTKVFGVAGDPIAHSLSPQLFNHWFRQHNCDAVFVPLCVGADRGGLAQFLGECEARRWLDVRGLSVTIPHKVEALKFVGDGADPMSRGIGAANTLVLGEAGRAAYNTDCYAAVNSLAATLGLGRNELAGLPVDVLGAGGAARAVCYGLAEMGCHVTVFARTHQITHDFERWGVPVREWGDRVKGTGEVLVNCTPLGMWPHATESPMPTSALSGRKLVFDLIYRPLKTKLLADATALGCGTLSGLDMFVRQAATQFALWTGISPDTASAYTMLEAALQAAGHRKKSLALIGARGSGKTTVGALLAKLLGIAHVDTDGLVMAGAGKSIKEIFEAEGEAGFRRREVEAVRSAIEMVPAVFSLGGGAVLDHGNVKAIRKVARVVWLSAPAEVLARRVAQDRKSCATRPALTSDKPITEMSEIIRIREPLYRAAADLLVDTSRLDAGEIAHRIAEWSSIN
jgi:3-dehydroquinate dehydratase / shikimate dehydrogenase